MKAKMPPSQKPPEQAEYQCLVCDTVFDFTPEGASALRCPGCGNEDRKDLVPIFIEDYVPEEKMYTSADWHGGA